MSEKHAPSTKLCGCLLEPIPDSQACDLCSEGTGTFNGEGWRIRLCALHAAAPKLLTACEAMVHAAKINDPAAGGVAAMLAAFAIAEVEGRSPPATTQQGEQRP